MLLQLFHCDKMGAVPEGKASSYMTILPMVMSDESSPKSDQSSPDQSSPKK